VRIFVVGSGGREHALCRAIAASPLCDALFCAPGNAGIARDATPVPIAADAIPELVSFATNSRIDLVVVGPEGPLVAGLADALRAAGIRAFGPSAAAARLEGSKGFMKDLCARHGIPTAAYRRFRDAAAARAYVRERGAPIVVKADGLAAGKGVTVAATVEEALAAVDAAMLGGAFGAAGAELVIEEFLDGEEASFISMVDGRTALPMATSQDHKRVGDGDTGPNTGGMGAYSPAPVVTPEVHARVMHEIVEPTVRGMAADGIPFTGFLYAGLMIDASGAPKVIEFNVRFGDPETQPVMLRLQSDLVDLVEAAISGRLEGVRADWDPRPSLGVVMAAANYPDTPRTGDVINAWDVPEEPGTKVFHAGTRAVGEHIETAGGRVLCCCALGETVADAQRRAYSLVAGIAWEGEFHRHDIGWRAIERERAAGA
jgi:phosphoribosylamine--glycine ligase